MTSSQSSEKFATFIQKLFIGSQYILPQHLLSRMVAVLADTKSETIKNFLIGRFVHQFEVDMSEAEEPDFKKYSTFNDFFTRAIKLDLRPIDQDTNTIVSPADGAISEIGDIKLHSIMQAKNHNYTLDNLLAYDDSAELFANGKFATIYLSPRDYHRLHMPVAGQLIKSVYVPGDLFSVNNTTAENVPNLFARNERLYCLFETENGPMGIVLVGAMIVAAIETVWAGRVTPRNKNINTIEYNKLSEKISFEKGEEFARFCLGSTAIVLLPEDKADWLDDLEKSDKVQMGQTIASYN